MKMSKLWHTVSVSDFLQISRACSVGLICPCIMDTSLDIEQLFKRTETFLQLEWVDF